MLKTAQNQIRDWLNVAINNIEPLQIECPCLNTGKMYY